MSLSSNDETKRPNQQQLLQLLLLLLLLMVLSMMMRMTHIINATYCWPAPVPEHKTATAPTLPTQLNMQWTLLYKRNGQPDNSCRAQPGLACASTCHTFNS